MRRSRPRACAYLIRRGRISVSGHSGVRVPPRGIIIMRTLATSTSRAGGMAPTSCTRKMAQHPESATSWRYGPGRLLA